MFTNTGSGTVFRSVAAALALHLAGVVCGSALVSSGQGLAWATAPNTDNSPVNNPNRYVESANPSGTASDATVTQGNSCPTGATNCTPNPITRAKMTLGISTIAELESYYNKICSKTVSVVESSTGHATGDHTGTLDAVSLSARSSNCEIVKSALKAAKNDRIRQNMWGAVTLMCGVACVAAKTPWGAWTEVVCQYGSLAAGLTDIVLSQQLTGLMNPGLLGMLTKPQTSIKVAFGGSAAREAASKAASAAATAAGKTAEEASKAGAEAGKEAGQSEKQGESCMSAAFAAFTTYTSYQSRVSDINTGKNTLEGLLILQDGAGQALAQIKDIGLSFNSGQTLTSDGASITTADPTKTTVANGLTNDTANNCENSNGALTLSCSVSQAGLPSKVADAFKDPALQQALDKGLPGGLDKWMGQEASWDQNKAAFAQAIGPGKEAAFNEILAGVENLKSEAPSTTYATNLGGANRAPSATTDPMADMMANLANMMNPDGTAKDGGVPTAAKLDFALHMKYMRDPASIPEAREISIFRRVTFRYQTVNEVQKLAGGPSLGASRAYMAPTQIRAPGSTGQ